MEEKLARRLLALSRTLVVIALVSLVGLLKRIDSQQILRDVIDLDALTTIGDRSFATTRNENETHAAVWSWLARTEPALEEGRLRLRAEMTEWLQQNHWTVPQLSGLAGKSQVQPIQEKKPFFTDELQLAPPSGEPARSEAVTPFILAGSVADFLDRLSGLCAPTRVALAIAATFPSGNEAKADGNCELLAITLADLAIEMRVRIIPPPMEQADIRETVTRIPVTVVGRNGPSLFELRLQQQPAANLLTRLAADDERREQFRAKYGVLAIGDAQSIARRSLGQAYESISLFGFSFAPARFPFAVLLLALLALGATAMTALRAQRMGARVFSEVELESAFDLVLDRPPGRFFIWVLLPPLSLLFALPALPPTHLESLLLWAGGAILTGVGLVAFTASRRL